ncbi:transposase, partial [Streptomyces durhamensis]|uniref:transposase n=1 Tax=Streptomyces durhamensis TaxID=68194 RepID=UPI001FD77D08
MRLGEVERLRGELAKSVGDVFASVPRRDQRRWGECYLRDLMLDGRGKSIQPMAERLPDGNMRPEDADEPTGYWMTNLPATTPIADLVRWAKMRWRIEHDYHELKHGLGLDHFE